MEGARREGAGREGWREREPTDPRPHSDRVNYERFKPRRRVSPLPLPISLVPRVYQRFVIVASTHMGSEVASPPHRPCQRPRGRGRTRGPTK